MVDSLTVTPSKINCSNSIRDRSPPPTKFLKTQFTKFSNSLTSETSVQKPSSISSISNTPDSEINEHLTGIEPSKLAEKLEGSENSNVIFDLRTACNYCRLHISTATLVNCSSKLKVRRAIQIVNDVIKSSPNLNEIILYTENGNSIKKEDHINSLIHFLLSHEIKCLYLMGGIKGFESVFPHFCESGSSTSLCLQIPKSIPDISDIYFTKPSQILPFLYLGNEFDALNNHFLTTNRITHILNLTLSVTFYDEFRFKSKRINCNDNHFQDLSQVLPEAFKFVELARESNGRILVHCQAGVSRSAAIVIAYLMSHTMNLCTLNSAWQWVKRRRNIISPNFNFMGQLVQFEHDLINGLVPRYSVISAVDSAGLLPPVPNTSTTTTTTNNAAVSSEQLTCSSFAGDISTTSNTTSNNSPYPVPS